MVGYRKGEFVDFDIEEALQMTKTVDEREFEISRLLSVMDEKER